MPANDPKPRRARPQEGRPAPEDATAGHPSRAASEELANAARDYNHAVHQAWLRAVEDSGKTNLAFAVAHQRLMQETHAQRITACFDWLGAVREAGADIGASAIKEAYEAYAKALEESAKAGRSGSEAAYQDCQGGLATVSDTYVSAIEEALGAYLSRLKEAWNSIDVAGADPQTLASLAAASVHAARAVRALPKHRGQAAAPQRRF